MPQNLLHRLPFCELVNQLVQIANSLHQGILDLFYANTAHYALDERTIRMNGWGLNEKGFKIVFLFDLPL